MTMANLSGQLLWDFCEELVASKAGYVWGARGNVYNEAEAQYLYKTYGSGTYNENYYKKSSMNRWKGRIVVDCSGMIQAFRIKYGDKKDATAQGLYTSCKQTGTINTLPTNKRGVLVFKKGTSTMTHVGVYGGDNTTIEAYSSEKGVIKTNPMVKNAWTHWGILPFIDVVTVYEEEDATDDEMEVPYRVSKCYRLNVRNKPSTKGSVKKVLNVDDIVYVYAINGNWAKISAVEELWTSMSYLKKLDSMRVTGCSYLAVRNQPNASGKQLRTLKKNDTVYVFGKASTGWIKISESEEYSSFKYLTAI